MSCAEGPEDKSRRYEKTGGLASAFRLRSVPAREPSSAHEVISAHSLVQVLRLRARSMLRRKNTAGCGRPSDRPWRYRVVRESSRTVQTLLLFAGGLRPGPGERPMSLTNSTSETTTAAPSGCRSRWIPIGSSELQAITPLNCAGTIKYLPLLLALYTAGWPGLRSIALLALVIRRGGRQWQKGFCSSKTTRTTA